MKAERTYNISKAVTSLLIILLFVGAPFMHGWSELLGSHGHHSHTSFHCSPEAELDACHRLIFHHDHASGCKHGQHLERSIQDCSLCAVVASLAVGTDISSGQLIALRKETRYSIIRVNAELLSDFSHSIWTRGPPPSLDLL